MLSPKLTKKQKRKGGGPYRTDYFPMKNFTGGINDGPEVAWISACVAGCGHLFTADVDPRMWELSTGRYVKSFLGHSGKVMTMKLLEREGEAPLLVTGSKDCSVRSWDLATGDSTKASETNNTQLLIDPPHLLRLLFTGTLHVPRDGGGRHLPHRGLPRSKASHVQL